MSLRRISISLIILTYLFSTAAAAKERELFIRAAMDSVPEDDSKTLSPYFFVLSDDPDSDRLPLKSTRAEVDIAGTIARVKVTQVYKNEGKSTLEAIYIFPASTRAAVYAMRMQVGKRTIEAKIKKRKEARKEYEKAKKEGKTASLLEQQRPNVFQMNVANILPNDEIKVELEYTELLVPTDGQYEFVYPTVVGPRYSNMKADDTCTKAKSPPTPSASRPPCAAAFQSPRSRAPPMKSTWNSKASRWPASRCRTATEATATSSLSMRSLERRSNTACFYMKVKKRTSS
jgi:Ca-activated chloride channel family protein